ncbi:endonuclease domain-containing protein [Sphingopyxis sp. PET50]|uniref:endonuclease domain-containing protein n=1 Tax=Sphingopyxis sp. PET50 TaxID=2976533 RepID=UPI0021AF6A5D|nr:endonuclease domain-containing protein [Sphingopyxis sp. PET50]
MRTYRHQPSGTVTRARTLRKSATEAEKRMWRALRETFPAIKWRRQVPIGPYFADFFSFAAKLVIEVDGGQHSEAASYDARRTEFLEAQGLTVLRFWNTDVLANTQGVMETISLSLREREGAAKRRKGEGDEPPPPDRRTPSPSQG